MLTSTLIKYSLSPQYQYYQAMWAFVGAGVKNVNQSANKIFPLSTVSILPGYVVIGRGRCQETEC